MLLSPLLDAIEDVEHDMEEIRDGKKKPDFDPEAIQTLAEMVERLAAIVKELQSISKS